MTDQFLIPLAACNAFQLTEDGVKGDWLIRENITDRELFRFRGRISDQDMFDILHFARQYELEAMNIGIQQQKRQQDAALTQEIVEVRARLEAMMHHNDFLASTVERLTTGDN